MHAHILRIALGTIGLLLIPLVAMQFTDQVRWSVFDFVLMGGIIFVFGLLLDVAIRKAGEYRAIAIVAIIAVFLWLWVELAVGLFTNWGS